MFVYGGPVAGSGDELCAEAIWTQAPDKLDRIIIVDFVPSLNQPGRWVASQWWPE